VAEGVRRLAFWAPLALCTWLALTPGPPAAVAEVSDVVLHLLAFAYLAFALSLAHFSNRWMMTLVCLLIYGAALELLQSTVSTRSAELKDLGMDLAGILVGLGLYRAIGGAIYAFTERMFGR